MISITSEDPNEEDDEAIPMLTASGKPVRYTINIRYTSSRACKLYEVNSPTTSSYFPPDQIILATLTDSSYLL